MAKGKSQNKGRAGNQFSKESFGKLSQDLQIFSVVKIMGSFANGAKKPRYL